MPGTRETAPRSSPERSSSVAGAATGVAHLHSSLLVSRDAHRCPQQGKDGDGPASLQSRTRVIILSSPHAPRSREVREQLIKRTPSQAAADRHSASQRSGCSRFVSRSFATWVPLVCGADRTCRLLVRTSNSECARTALPSGVMEYGWMQGCKIAHTVGTDAAPVRLQESLHFLDGVEGRTSRMATDHRDVLAAEMLLRWLGA
ncbi:hypothetical protein BD309DRAFT_366653 [Dichomitus squalens]|uniref:Uncharacterized protein n=1 Tax=Dichomitus squalens TaxID=114155 RepID=A0A4Q9NI81_9APHY|nr:hypothetical protein BD309DRAFT_366653 [Dichomitus squalens]TBU53247.1 hypothetical protein BD310DRAFT_168050 [Dichomitus squalens]